MNTPDIAQKPQTHAASLCLAGLSDTILGFHGGISQQWYFRLPYFKYNGQALCFLWVDPKTGFPYMALRQGDKIAHPRLVAASQPYAKKLVVDPGKAIPTHTIHGILRKALALY